MLGGGGGGVWGGGVEVGKLVTGACGAGCTEGVGLGGKEVEERWGVGWGGVGGGKEGRGKEGGEGGGEEGATFFFPSSDFKFRVFIFGTSTGTSRLFR